MPSIDRCISDADYALVVLGKPNVITIANNIIEAAEQKILLSWWAWKKLERYLQHIRAEICHTFFDYDYKSVTTTENMLYKLLQNKGLDVAMRIVVAAIGRANSILPLLHISGSAPGYIL